VLSAPIIALMMEAVSISETSVKYLKTTERYISEDYIFNLVTYQQVANL
jgi:hypothetical protein